MPNEDFRGEELNSMSFSPDGNTLYIPGTQFGPAIIAVDIKNQYVKWKFGKRRLALIASPIIDSKGNIYVCSEGDQKQGYLYYLDNEGEIILKHQIEKYFGRLEPYNHFALDKLGNIYIGRDSLFSINQDGNLNWKVNISGKIISPMAIDGVNNIYFITYTYSDHSADNVGSLVKVDKNGDVIGSIVLNDISATGFTYPISIGMGNSIYIPGYTTKKLLKIK